MFIPERKRKFYNFSVIFSISQLALILPLTKTANGNYLISANCI